jgi:dephospho-CoA kinase
MKDHNHPPQQITLGLTGGIASGKSTVLNQFRKRGAAVIDCDKIAREVVRKGEPALAKIIKLFGRRVLKRDGSLDRAALGRIAFSNSAKRKALEKIIHPEVKREVFKRVKKIRQDVIVVDVPLLFEAKWQACFDKTLVVWTTEKTQVSRLMRRDGFSRGEAIKRIRAQMPLAQKKRLADFVINNSGRAALTQAQIKNFL